MSQIPPYKADLIQDIYEKTCIFMKMHPYIVIIQSEDDKEFYIIRYNNSANEFMKNIGITLKKELPINDLFSDEEYLIIQSILTSLIENKGIEITLINGLNESMIYFVGFSHSFLPQTSFSLSNFGKGKTAQILFLGSGKKIPMKQALREVKELKHDLTTSTMLIVHAQKILFENTESPLGLDIIKNYFTQGVIDFSNAIVHFFGRLNEQLFPEKVLIGNLIKDIIKSANLSKISIEFETESDAHKDYIINVDRFLMERVFINIFRNSIEAATERKIEDPKIRICLQPSPSTEQKENFCKVIIKDNCGGIEKEILNNLGKKRVSTKESHKHEHGWGTSSIINNINKHQGDVVFNNFVNNNGEKGTKVILLIPIHKA
ncbi:MAG: ATP-binding protein [Candidatus Hodarchaeales archaeon]|jgi:hypothetical protein